MLFSKYSKSKPCRYDNHQKKKKNMRRKDKGNEKYIHTLTSQSYILNHLDRKKRKEKNSPPTFIHSSRNRPPMYRREWCLITKQIPSSHSGNISFFHEFPLQKTLDSASLLNVVACIVHPIPFICLWWNKFIHVCAVSIMFVTVFTYFLSLFLTFSFLDFLKINR